MKQGNIGNYNPGLPNDKDIQSGSGAPNEGNSALTGENSSQMMLNRPDDSQEQIALLPESAFTNNMQNLNIRSGERKTKEENQINFYQEARVDTEVSG